jgi:hypothetical protein
VTVVRDFERQRNSCGHWDWQADDVDGLEPGYQVCPLCAELGPYEQGVRDQNRKRDRDQYGLTFGWYPPRKDGDDGD